MEKRRKLYCDICRKDIHTWNPFNKAVRLRVRIPKPDVIWDEYYHMKCLIKAGVLVKRPKQKAGRWDKNEDDGTNNLVH